MFNNFFVNSSMKYFVIWQQCEVNPLLISWQHLTPFILLTATSTLTTIKGELLFLFDGKIGYAIMLQCHDLPTWFLLFRLVHCRKHESFIFPWHLCAANIWGLHKYERRILVRCDWNNSVKIVLCLPHKTLSLQPLTYVDVSSYFTECT
jgi:hypothetical protein